jgi:hypothetical protein
MALQQADQPQIEQPDEFDPLPMPSYDGSGTPN